LRLVGLAGRSEVTDRIECKGVPIVIISSYLYTDLSPFLRIRTFVEMLHYLLSKSRTIMNGLFYKCIVYRNWSYTIINLESFKCFPKYAIFVNS
jgi:hypothetical protein